MSHVTKDGRQDVEGNTSDFVSYSNQTNVNSQFNGTLKHKYW